MDFEVHDVEKEERIKKRNQKTRYLFIAAGILLFISIVLIAYYFISNSGNSKQKPKTTPKPVVKEEVKQLTIFDENSNDRPICVMIDNLVGNNNHVGLQKSYLNYEIIVEGGLTRIMAIYKDRDISLIGPVRSARHYFLDYALENDCIYSHHGGSPQAYNNISSLNISDIDGMTSPNAFARDSSIAAPHNVFTSIKRIKTEAEKKKYSTESQNWKLFKYSPDEIDLSKDQSTELLTANNISMSYSNSEIRGYTYDINNKYYLRTMKGQPHIDRITQQQLNYKNIIIIRVNNKTIDRDGRQDLDNIGNGDGYFITNGYALPIKWSKDSRTNKTIYTYTNGEEITLNDGNTFVQIVPINNNITIG